MRADKRCKHGVMLGSYCDSCEWEAYCKPEHKREKWMILKGAFIAVCFILFCWGVYLLQQIMRHQS